MICQIFNWLFPAAGPSTLQLAFVGVGSLLTYDAVARWRKNRTGTASAKHASGKKIAPKHDQKIERRRAA